MEQHALTAFSRRIKIIKESQMDILEVKKKMVT